MKLSALYSVLCLLIAVLFITGCESDNDDKEPEFPVGAQWIYGPDISAWPKTITLNSATVTPIRADYFRIEVEYEGLQELPAWFQRPDPRGYNNENVNGTIWLIRNFQGQWYVGSIDYLRVGQTVKTFAVHPSFLIAAQPGEQLGVMISTVSREWDGTRVDGDPNSPYRQRSNVYWTTWP